MEELENHKVDNNYDDDTGILSKDWGTDELIFRNCIMSLHRVEIDKGGKSSYGKFHRHIRKYNLIYVEAGTLKLFTITHTKGIQEFTLGPDERFQQYKVYPGVRHRFEAVTEVIAYELYYSYTNEDDIVRDNG